MYDHTSSVYNNNCVKVPRNPHNDHPHTQFDQKFLHDLHNQVTKNLNETMKVDLAESDGGDVKTFIDFFDSIPEYDDINHLSNKEFYTKLEKLKEKQREFYQYVNSQMKDTGWMDDYKHNVKMDYAKRKSAIKSFCGTPTLKKFDDESLSDKEATKPSSRRSVRIETPSMKSSSDFTPEPFLLTKSQATWDDLPPIELNLDTSTPLGSKSVPNSPLRTRKSAYDGITVPKPFQMTVRDEENKIVEELFLKVNKPGEEKLPQQFKAHEVPIESQIPLFDKIMEDQQIRSEKVKEKRKADLQAQMRPFSFTRRDEEIQELTKKFSKSLPCVYNDDVPLKVKKFKAKPIPKNLFSNYIYKKMHEDEFYRALQKKVRAEEMLKHASLPPSMAKRERTKPKIDVCPRSYRDIQLPETPLPKKHRKIPNYKAYHDKYERELEELKNEFISTSPRPFKLKCFGNNKKARKYARISSATSKSSSETRTPSSLDMSSINRSNLAAVLRIHSARQRLEMEMTRKLEEAKLKEEARWREKLMRKKPVWQALAFSHEEDLAMRLQLRRDEEKLRNEEHRLRMELMLGRVHQQPTLFERQSQIKFPKTKEGLIEQLHREYKAFGGDKKRRGVKKEAALEVEEGLEESVEEDEMLKSAGKEECECASNETK